MLARLVRGYIALAFSAGVRTAGRLQANALLLLLSQGDKLSYMTRAL